MIHGIFFFHLKDSFSSTKDTVMRKKQGAEAQYLPNHSKKGY